MHSRGIDIPNLYKTLANSPRMLQAWIDLSWPLRHEPSSPRSLRELMIMRVAQLTNSTYEWCHHWAMAITHGVREKQLRELSHWQSSGEFTAQEKAALKYADAITAMDVADETFEEIRRTFAPEVIVELTLTAAFYTTVARVLQALQIELEPGYEKYATYLKS